MSFDQARQVAESVAREVTPGPTSPIELELYLSQIPSAVQQSLKRPEDPAGSTVPPSFTFASAEDVLKLLPPRPPRFRPGSALTGKPGWVLEKPLGVGGFGEVWLARHNQMSSLIGAVKFCHGQQARDLKHESALIDRVMSAGTHPNIVPLKDVNLEGETPWLMYEYVSGGDLADWLRGLQRNAPEQRVKQATTALRQLAGAVGHFHRLTPPVVHRDLKPANILTDKINRRLRITDFGIGSVAAKSALEAEARGQTSRTGRLMSYLQGSHTPLYASPQQRAGAPADPRDDIHALGVIGYQLITGHLDQGAGPDFAEDLREHAASPELIALLGRCVAQKPDRRPRDGAEFASLLAELHSTAVQNPASPPHVSPPHVSPPSPKVTEATTSVAPATMTTPTLPPPPVAALPVGRPTTETLSTPTGVPASNLSPTSTKSELPMTTSSVTPPNSGASEAAGGEVRGVESAPTALTAEEVIQRFEREGGQRGATATAGSQFYETATRIKFVPCRCGWDNPEYHCHEYIARNSRGTCYYICHNLHTAKITVGPKGFHHQNPDVPECIPGTRPQRKTFVDQGRQRFGHLVGEREILAADSPLRASLWFKPLEEADGHWQPVSDTSIYDGESYHLQFDYNIDDEDLAGLDTLADIRQLQKMSLEKSENLTHSAYSRLSKFVHLKSLSLRGSSVGDEDLRYLSELSALQTLDLEETRVTQSGVSKLRQRLPQCEILVTPCLEIRDVNLPGTWWGKSEEEDAELEGDDEVDDEMEEDEELERDEQEDEETEADEWEWHRATPCRVAIRDNEVYGFWVEADGLADVAGLETLADIQQLHTLCIRHGKTLAPDAFARLAGFRYLKTLSLDKSSIDDAGLRYLADLGDLEELSLQWAELDGSGLRSLSSLSNLTDLDLRYTALKKADFFGLTRLSRLESLWLAETGITDPSLAPLAEMASLKNLELNDTQVMDAGLEHCSRNAHLETLWLDGTKVTDAGLAACTRMTGLSGLSLGRTSVSDVGLAHLARCPWLEQVDLSETRVSSAGLIHLRGMSNLTWLSLDGCQQVTDEGLQQLYSLAKLETLNLNGTKVTRNGVSELQKALPDCEIEATPARTRRSTRTRKTE